MRETGKRRQRISGIRIPCKAVGRGRDSLRCCLKPGHGTAPCTLPESLSIYNHTTINGLYARRYRSEQWAQAGYVVSMRTAHHRRRPILRFRSVMLRDTRGWLHRACCGSWACSRIPGFFGWPRQSLERGFQLQGCAFRIARRHRYDAPGFVHAGVFRTLAFQMQAETLLQIGGGTRVIGSARAFDDVHTPLHTPSLNQREPLLLTGLDYA